MYYGGCGIKFFKEMSVDLIEALQKKKKLSVDFMEDLNFLNYVH